MNILHKCRLMQTYLQTLPCLATIVKRGKMLLKQMPCFFIVAFISIICSCAGQQTTPSVDTTGNNLSVATLESVRNEAPLSQRFDNIVFLSVQATDTVQKHYSEALEQFETAMVSHLRGKNAFDEVDQNTDRILQGKTILVETSIYDMRITSSSARFWGGAMAGSSYMSVSVKLVDMATGQTLRSESITSGNNPLGAALTGGSTDKSLPIDMGQIVGEYLYTVVPSRQ